MCWGGRGDICTSSIASEAFSSEHYTTPCSQPTDTAKVQYKLNIKRQNKPNATDIQVKKVCAHGSGRPLSVYHRIHKHLSNGYMKNPEY